MRNLTKTLAAVSLLAPASAFSLGVGDIKLHSALNQKLNAEIALLVSKGENVSSIQVKIAPPDKFDEAGVPWSYFLSKIKFKQITKADGSIVVKLSSEEALREPFLDFLLEVIWDKGNLYREFTVLVDPPVAYKQPVIPVVNKASQTTQGSESEGQLVTTPVASHSFDGGGGQVDDSYGPTGRSDSVWKIAQRHNHYSDVSIEQMMMAIYKANPQAFYKDNVNALMAGKTLKIPEKQAILKLSKKAALNAFNRQRNAWSGRVSPKKNTQTANANNSSDNIQLELQAPVESEVAATTQVISENSASNDAVEQTNNAIASASLDKQSLALHARMEKLEQQLLMMQKMLSLKDEQIATLQNKAQLASVAEGSKDNTKGKNGSPSQNIETISTTVTALGSENDLQKADAERKAKAKKARAKARAKAKVKKARAKAKADKLAQEQADSELMTLAGGGLGLGLLGLLGWFWWRKRQSEEETESESMFAYASEISLPEPSLDDTSSATFVDELDVASVVGGASDSSSYDVGTVGESSFLSEFTPSDFDAFDTDQNEVDPISEADVYLAYGRYQQAEELMRQAINDEPDRDECKLKLLEIFYANEDADSYEVFSKELISAGKNTDHAFWLKVVDMGKELLPESAVFSEPGIEPFADVADEAPVSKDVTEVSVNEGLEEEAHSDMDFDLSVFDDNEMDLSSATEMEGHDDGIDFDLSVFDLDQSVETAISEEAGQNEGVKAAIKTDDEVLETVEFDLNTVEFDKTDEPETTSREKDELETFEMDLLDSPEIESNDKVSEEAILGADADTSNSLERIDLSFEDNTLSDVRTDESLGSEKASAEEPSNDSLDDFDFDFDLDSEVSELTVEPVANLDVNVSDLTDMDELETKIDLAKAYIDMDDFDAARNIAKEVLDNGTPEQKQAAQDIIDQLK